MNWLKSAVFLVAAPGTVCGLIPWLIYRWTPHYDFGNWRYLGAPGLVLGAIILLWCFGDFVVAGKGTANPNSPPKKLVVHGFYRWSRNPMYVAILAILEGEAFWFGSLSIFFWVVIAWAIFDQRVKRFEEPWLRQQFGAEFDEYCERVRRWI